MEKNSSAVIRSLDATFHSFKTILIIFHVVCFFWGGGRGRDGSVGVATRYGLDGPGIESVTQLVEAQRYNSEGCGFES